MGEFLNFRNSPFYPFTFVSKKNGEAGDLSGIEQVGAMSKYK
jgi:hypothetical protein